MNNIMLDLETMGRGPNSAIIAVGAVRFDDDVTDKFYKLITLRSSVKAGLEMDPDTVMWWLGQDKKAQEQFELPAVDLEECLDLFADWIGDDAIVWGNGAAFDNVILANAYDKVDIETPWSFMNDRCYRTMKNMKPEIKMKRTGIFHCAVDDAESQARHLMTILAG